jgi:hypothetical protein
MTLVCGGLCLSTRRLSCKLVIAINHEVRFQIPFVPSYLYHLRTDSELRGVKDRAFAFCDPLGWPMSLNPVLVTSLSISDWVDLVTPVVVGVLLARR